jgi:4-aminobutyrate aminotransferase
VINTGDSSPVDQVGDDVWLDPARPVPEIRTELPGPEARVVLDRDRRVTSRSLPRAYPLVPSRGTGAVLEDVDGNLFLDFNAGIAVCSTGHAHPRVVEAVRRQAGALLHYSASDFYLPIYSEMAEALAATAPMPGPVRVFLTNSGTEAVEGALKLARAATGRQYVIAFHGAFHGRSYGSVSLTASKAKYHAGFGPLLPGVLHTPYAYCHRCPLNLTWPACDHATVDAIEQVLFRYQVEPSEVAAVFVEPVQGEGGYIVPPPGWLEKLSALCRRHGILLVADEVQCGVGRTGKMWACEHEAVEPDILLTAKGIASGMPVGAMIAKSEVMSWGPGAHGSTYGGNPVALAALMETVRLLEGGLIANAGIRGREIMDGLAPLQDRFPGIVRDVRGKGLMIGIQFDSGETAEAVQMQAFDRGLLVLEAGDDCVRMSPPLVVSQVEAATAVRIFTESVAHVVANRGADLREVELATSQGMSVQGIESAG